MIFPRPRVAGVFFCEQSGTSTGQRFSHSTILSATGHFTASVWFEAVLRLLCWCCNKFHQPWQHNARTGPCVEHTRAMDGGSSTCADSAPPCPALLQQPTSARMVEWLKGNVQSLIS